MADPKPHCKRVRHIEVPRQARLLTFSRYKRLPLLMSEPRRSIVGEALERATRSHGMFLLALVFIREHVHLVVLPWHKPPDMPAFLFALKRRSSYRIREQMEDARDFVDTSFTTSISPETRESFGIDAPKIILGNIATGDRFVSTASDASAVRQLTRSCVCVDMERAAVAQACIEQSTPFGIVRIISDRADESAPIDFSRFVSEVATVYSDEIITRALRPGA